MAEQDINTLTTCIALMEQHSKAHILSVGLTLTMSLLLPYLVNMKILSPFWMMALVAVIILGLLEMVYAIRIGFDLSLLHQISNNKGAIESGLSTIDNSLIKLRLIPPQKVGRNLDDRLTGCVRLFRTQISICALQLIMVVGATLLYLLPG